MADPQCMPLRARIAFHDKRRRTTIITYWLKPWFCLCLAIAVGLTAHRVQAQETDADPLLESLRWDRPVELCGEEVPLDEWPVAERMEKEMLLSLGNRPQVILWLKRTTRYFPFIEKVLAESGLPEDLKYLAIAESALRRHAGSRKGAMGVWQLMPQTARRYGLTVNGRLDERRSFFQSTPAAASYLQELHARFGSWSLALAAYNMGEEGLAAEILEQGISDYYRLYLPLETQRFVFRVLAIKLIVQDPEKYGFALAATDYYPPAPFATVLVNAFAELPLRLIAQASETDFKTIKELNPQVRGYFVAAGSYRIRIPPDGMAGFQERLGELVATDTRIRSQSVYRVREGDSLSGIAEKFDVPLAALLIWNRIRIDTVIHPGQQLVILPGKVNPGKTPKRPEELGTDD